MTPIVQALLFGFSNLFAFVYALIQYVKQQTRIATATDGSLDMIAVDYFGSNLPRASAQSDASYRALIQANLLRKRCTRQSVIDVLTKITGIAPIVFEPMRPFDSGVYGGPGVAYNTVGGYGSTARPFQSFVRAFRPPGAGVASIAGYGNPQGAYNTPSQTEYSNPSMIANFVSDADIYAAVNSVRPASYTIWVAIEAAPPLPSGSPLVIGGMELLIRPGVPLFVG